jgi:SPP1 family predicted phage head-tail adaptor
MTFFKKMKSGAGRLNRLVSIYRASNSAPNGSYEVVPSYTLLTQRWAEMATNGGREFQAAMQTVAMLQCILKIRYDQITKTITSRDQVQINGRVLNIAAVFNESENNEKIVLWCVEVA